MSDKNLTAKPVCVVAYILIRNKLARMDEIQNWIKVCCQGKEQGKERSAIEAKICDESKMNIFKTIKFKYIDSGSASATAYQLLPAHNPKSIQ